MDFFCCAFSNGGSADGDKSHLMKTLMEAEAAANSAAVQLVSFKDAVEEEFAVCFPISCLFTAAQKIIIINATSIPPNMASE